MRKRECKPLEDFKPGKWIMISMYKKDQLMISEKKTIVDSPVQGVD